MFTGIIRHLGKIKKTIPYRGGRLIEVEAPNDVINLLNIGDSIAVSGACQTITNISNKTFSFFASGETLSKTNFTKLKPNDIVNLELPITANTRLDGHIVTGHVDTTLPIKKILKLTDRISIIMGLSPKYSYLIVEKGSIAIEGISLTVNELKVDTFRLDIIPFTYENTNLKYKKIGDQLNVEFDIIGKYIIRLAKQKEEEVKYVQI